MRILLGLIFFIPGFERDTVSILYLRVRLEQCNPAPKYRFGSLSNILMIGPQDSRL